MTRRMSLIIGVAVVALAVGVPTALGKGGQLAESPVPMSAVEYFKANERATLAQSGQSSAVEYFKANELATLVQSGESALTGYRDAFERGNVAGNQPSVSTYRDSFERGAQVDVKTGLESNVGSYRDAFERANPSNVPVATSPVGSGTEIEWPQVGIGLGIGLLLALGLGLTMRAVHIRPFAH